MRKVKFLNAHGLPVIRNIINRIKESTKTHELVCYYEIDTTLNKKVLSVENVSHNELKPHIDKILNAVNRQFNTKIEYYVSANK